VCEAMHALPGDIVVIVQGDEPLLMPEAVERVVRPLRDDPGVDCTNLLSPLDGDRDLDNPDIVKAVCAQDGRIMFLSRSPIPSYRKRVVCPVYRQTGIMAFRLGLLQRYARLPETPFEQAESVDMLRLLEHGLSIHGVVIDYATVGVDRPGDVPAVERWFRDSPEQKALLEQTLGTPWP
jgi:3-deoxy-manno-octulosonate cytidylyltransferase (CMP-KDO synthetase)